MNRHAIFISMLLALTGAVLVTFDFVSAVGGGGGGGGGSTEQNCTQDTWTCGTWESCTTDGSQTRECVLIDDCPYASTPAETEQSCQPPCLVDTFSCTAWGSCDASGSQTRSCTRVDDCPAANDPVPIQEQECDGACEEDQWSCDDWSVCSADGNQSRDCVKSFDCPSLDTPPPAESQTCTPGCTADEWSCTGFSACDTSGNQYRTCTLSFDCAVSDDPKPVEAQPCDHLQCGDLPSLRDRVACRLNLTPEGIARELQIRYLPEACAVLQAEEQRECTQYYADFQQCWLFPAGYARFTCAQRVVGLDGDIATMKADCEALSDVEAETCLADLTENVYALIAFRMYDLEERAEDFGALGMPLDPVIDMVMQVIEHKIAFHNAESYTERRAVLLDLRTDWEAFIVQVKAWRGEE